MQQKTRSNASRLVWFAATEYGGNFLSESQEIDRTGMIEESVGKAGLLGCDPRHAFCVEYTAEFIY